VEKRFSTLVAASFAIVAALAALPASAQRGAEAQARALDKKAMEDDYLATEFDKAADKLNKAIALCGENKCGPAFRAVLRRDLGVVFMGKSDKERCVQSFADALKIDPNVALDPDVKTKELDAAFEQARRKAGLASGGAGVQAASGGLPTGDFVHTPANEQRVQTPVPVYVEYAGVETLTKVMLRYKAVGMTDFKALELRKMGKGWGGEVPCADVLEGQVVYYLQGFNDKNDPVATSGDRNNTYRVPIKQKLDGEAPHNPDQPPPAQCGDTSDCPPGFPCETKGGDGAAAASGGSKLEGESCDENSECKSGDCRAGKCTSPDEKAKAPKLFFGVGGSIDFTLLSSGQDVCLLNNKTAIPINDGGYYCTNPSGTDYPRRDKNLENGLLQPGRAGSVNGGVAPANLRIWLSLDYALSANFLLGLRAGVVLRGYPGDAAQQDGKPILPFHAEVRGTYLVGKDALLQKFAPYILVGAGASQFTASVDVPVSETGANPPTKTVQAWVVGGPGFATLGGGVRIALGSPRAALMFTPIKGNLAFGSGPLVPSLQPELGIQFGF